MSWSLGPKLQGADRAGYGENLFNELAAKLAQHNVSGCRFRQLYNYRAFYRAYPQIVRTVSAKSKELLHTIVQPSEMIDLKVDEFNHEHLGQLNTYVNWYKKNVMAESDNPPVGILLCTQKDHALVEYALAGMNNKLFVSKYQLELPKKEEMEKFIEEQMKEVQG